MADPGPEPDGRYVFRVHLTGTSGAGKKTLFETLDKNPDKPHGSERFFDTAVDGASVPVRLVVTMDTSFTYIAASFHKSIQNLNRNAIKDASAVLVLFDMSVSSSIEAAKTEVIPRVHEDVHRGQLVYVLGNKMDEIGVDMVEPGFFDGLDVTLLNPPASAKNREGVTGALQWIAQALVNKAIPLRAERALHLDSVSFGPVPNFDKEGGCDPYVVVECDGTQVKSTKSLAKHVPSTVSSVWIQVTAPLTGDVVIKFMDKDRFTRDDKMFDIAVGSVDTLLEHTVKGLDGTFEFDRRLLDIHVDDNDPDFAHVAENFSGTLYFSLH